MKISDTQQEALEAIAMGLLWEGHDRAADAIYARLEARSDTPVATLG